ncbi:MAG: hypothetical protein AB7Q23_11965 [Hyphomonadaceae bacterium]
MTTANKAIVFLVLAFAITWAIVGAGWTMGWHNTQQTAVATLAASMFGPSIAAVICAVAFEKGRRKEALGLFFKPTLWWLWAWLIALAIAFGASLVTVLAGKHSSPTSAPTISRCRARPRRNMPSKSTRLRNFPASPGSSLRKPPSWAR